MTTTTAARSAFKQIARLSSIVGAGAIVAAAIVTLIVIDQRSQRGSTEPGAERRVDIDIEDVESLRAAFRARPSAAARRALIEALFVVGRPEEAAGLLQFDSSETSALEPLESAVWRSEARFRLGDLEGAAAELPTIARALPGRARVLEGRLAFARGDVAAAERAVREAVRLGDESLADAWMLRAQLALSGDRGDEARAAAERAREAGASSRFVDGVHVEALIRAGQADAARRLLAELNTGDPSQDDAYTDYLSLLLNVQQGDYADAARRLRRIESRLLQEPRGPLIAMYAHAGAGNFAQAERLLLQMVDRAPTDLLAHEAYFWLLMVQGRVETARAVAEQMTVLSPTGRTLAIVALDATSSLDAAAALIAQSPIVSLNEPRRRLFGPLVAEPAAEREGRALIEALRQGADALRSGDNLKPARDALAPLIDHPIAALFAGHAARADADLESARNYFSRARAADPNSFAALEASVALAIRMDRMEEARALVEAARRENSRDANISLLSVRLHRLFGDALAAKNVIRALPADGRIDPNTADWIAWPFAAPADELAPLAAALSRSAPTAAGVAPLLLAAGLVEESLAQARRAMIAAPDDPDAARAYFDAANAAARPQSEIDAFPAAIRDAQRAGADHEANAEKSRESVQTEARYSLNPRWRGHFSVREASILEAGGERTAAAAAWREACFWGEAQACPDTRPGTEHG